MEEGKKEENKAANITYVHAHPMMHGAYGHPMMGMYPHHPYPHSHLGPVQIHHHVPGGKDAPNPPLPTVTHVPHYPYLHSPYHHPFGYGHPMGMPGTHVYHTTPPSGDKKGGGDKKK